MSQSVAFDTAFPLLTGHAPFPWQRALYEKLLANEIPDACTLPTGLGKTSVVALWLIALANAPDRLPRRLVYVVNRRTVVDQTTEEVVRYQGNLRTAGLWEPLAMLAGVSDHPLAVSTLRGQFADNREWSANPARPAVICGTVDMIGSRLLFSGYGVGMKARPLHAGLLGQDTLLVHDEAHLEPAFQCLLDSLAREQQRCREFRPFRVMELTATPRSGGKVFELTQEEKNAPAEIPDPPMEPIHHVWRRTQANKALVPHPVEDEKKDLVPTIVRLALQYHDAKTRPAVLVFVRTVEAVHGVVVGLKKGKVPEGNILTLTGTMRGYERDEMATTNGVFARFRRGSPAPPVEGTVYLVCTSAGEVGVDMSAVHTVCDLSTYESMAQRFGRVNRYGNGAARIDVVHPKEFVTRDKPLELARERTLRLLERLRTRPDGLRDASPAALGDLVERAIREGSGEGGLAMDRTEVLKKYILSAFAPTPTILPVTDILFDAWALTTIREKLPGRPKVEPYLHGMAEWQPPETQVAWREEVGEVTKVFAARYPPRRLLEAYPLRPHELLREPSYRAFEQFLKLAKRRPDEPVWLLDEDGSVEILTLEELADKDEKDRIEGKTVLLAPRAGGLDGGMLNGDSESADDVSCVPVAGATTRKRVWDDEPDPDGMRKALTLHFSTSDEDEDEDGREWRWFETGNEGDRSAQLPVEWHVHVADVERQTAQIVDCLPLGDDLRRAVKLAARFHDHGKLRKQFQIVLGNSRYPAVKLAKSGKQGGRIEELYRHEFGSLAEVLDEAKEFHVELASRSPELRELVLHLIASHHGRARPHFPADEAFDPHYPSAVAEGIAREVPRRFARLQRRYGRWGLAYLESLLRAADWAASASPSAYLGEDE